MTTPVPLWLLIAAVVLIGALAISLGRANRTLNRIIAEELRQSVTDDHR